MHFTQQGSNHMDLDTFVKQLADAAPSLDDLVKIGLSSEEADEFISSFRCVRRRPPATSPEGEDVLLSLLRHWDLTRVEIGMVRFPDVPSGEAGKLVVGLVEADPLVMLSHDGEIVVHELGTQEHLLWRVAINSEAFLKAFLVAASFLGKQAVGKIDFDDCEAAASVAAQCAFTAGGDNYLDFYRMLLGAE